MIKIDVDLLGTFFLNFVRGISYEDFENISYYTCSLSNTNINVATINFKVKAYCRCKDEDYYLSEVEFIFHRNDDATFNFDYKLGITGDWTNKQNSNRRFAQFAGEEFLTSYGHLYAKKRLPPQL